MASSNHTVRILHDVGGPVWFGGAWVWLVPMGAIMGEQQRPQQVVHGVRQRVAGAGG